MGNSAGQMNPNDVVLPNAQTPENLINSIRKFQCGATDPAYAKLKYGLLPWVAGTGAFKFEFVASFDETTGAPIAAGTNGNDIGASVQTVSFINGASENSSKNIPGSPDFKDGSSNYDYLGGEIIPRGRCFMVVGVMAHARRGYQMMANTSPAAAPETRVPLWFTLAEDSQQLANLAFHELLENVSLSVTNDVAEDTFLLGAAKDHKDMISGAKNYTGEGRLVGSYNMFACPLITADSRSMNAYRFDGKLEKPLRIGTDHSNNGAGAGPLGTGIAPSVSDPSLYLEIKLFLVGMVICCPPDKLCDIVSLSNVATTDRPIPQGF